MMGVVFDEVLTQVEAPERFEETEPGQEREHMPLHQEVISLEQQLKTTWRRQQRLEAD